jgi:hypothetical protein
MPFRADAGLLLAKIETTSGTDSVPTAAANALLVRNLSVRPEPAIIARDFLRDSLSSLKDVVARTVMNVSFEFAIKGAGGAVDAVPRYGPILRAFQFGQTVNAGVNVTYAFVNSSHESCTLYAYMDGILHKLTFGSGKRFTIKQAVNEFPVASVEMNALYVAPTDTAIAGGAVFDPSVEVPMQALAFTLGGYSPIAKMLEISLDTGLSIREDLHATNGIVGFMQGRRNVTGRIDPEAVTEATHPWWANFVAGTSVALASNTIGTAVGNRVAINAPAVQYDGPNWAARERVRNYDVGLRIRASTDTASDEMSIVTT